MDASLSINALQVNFESVLSIEHVGMAAKQKKGHEGGISVGARHCGQGTVRQTLFLRCGDIGEVGDDGGDQRQFEVPLSILLEKMVKADIGESVKLHPLKVLNHKSVLTYMKTNQAIPQAAGRSEERWSCSKTQIGVSSSDSGSTMSLPLVAIAKKQRTKRTKPVKKTDDNQAESNPGPILEIPAEAEDVSTSAAPSEPEQPTQQSVTFDGKGIFAPVEIRDINRVTQFLPKIDPAAKGRGTNSARRATG
ncbi:hypothetical protein F511_24604 [Dorcoceras hygrometricum]|uniref:Uncharacterized protein n=1 Tax=Dorcoceras hygrometricum TaxID=472368 RepID=A0A2Z7A838_9LAMI|nr:hypothetical protein F511_24604 [Dorcoceras hygrometricum]